MGYSVSDNVCIRAIGKCSDSIKRAKIAPHIASHMMFAREKIRLVHEYYEKLTGKSLATAYLPKFEQEETDVGQDDHLLKM